MKHFLHQYTNQPSLPSYTSHIVNNQGQISQLIEKKMKTLVTGSTGLIGSSLVPILAEKGFKVRLLVRTPSKAKHLEKYGVEIFKGDLCDESSVNAAIEGCRYLFHLAADYRLWVPNPESMFRTNVEGTRILMEKALEHNVERIVYTSSVCTLGSAYPGEAADEEARSSLADMISHYKKSKFLAEEVVNELVKDKGLPAVIVNPSTPVGPGDSRPTPTGAMILSTARDGGRFYAETGLNIAHVEDIAAGHLLALEKGEIGRRYILGGENLKLKDLFAITSAIAGKPGPRIKVPSAVLYPVAIISETLARLKIIRDPAATLDSIRMAKKLMFYDSKRAETELGYTHRPASEAIGDAVNWFRENKML